MPEPWEKQKGESKKAFEAFAKYRDMGSARSYAKTAQALGKSKKLMDDWGRKWRWQERIGAWDDEQDRVIREQALADLKEMNRRHVTAAIAFQAKALQKLQSMAQNGSELSPTDAIRYLEVATKVERLARGEATEKVKGEVDHKGEVKHNHEGAIDVTHELDLSGLSLEELKQLEAIISKATEPGEGKDGPGGAGA